METTDATSNASQIDCHGVSVVFDRRVTAVDQVELTIPQGEIVSLVGPSGCGKTTLLRTLAGLQPLTSGSVQINPSADPRQGEIAFVFQQPSLLPWRTALENVALPLQLTQQSMSNADAFAAARRVLDSVHLSDAMDRFPRQLSGGMQMRVSIARALVTRPRVLLLDEPFAALDEMLRNELGQLLLELWHQRGFTAVMVTHNVAESILLSNRIVVMRAGRVTDRLDNPISRPRNVALQRTAEFASFHGVVTDAMQGKEEVR